MIIICGVIIKTFVVIKNDFCSMIQIPLAVFWKWFLIIICKIIYYIQNFKDICPVCSKTTRIPKYKTRGFPHWSIMRQLFKISVLWKSQHVSNMDISLDYWIFSWVVAEVEHTIAKSTKMYSPLIWQHGILDIYFQVLS